MVGSALAFSLMSLFVKLAGSRFGTMELVFARAVVVAALAGTVLALRRVGLARANWRLLVLRGVLGLVALSCFYFSVIHLPLAEATVIHFTNPVFTAAVAALFLGERMRPREVGLSLLALSGVVVMVRPGGWGGPAAPLDPLAVASGLTAAVLAAVAYALVRRLRDHDPFVVVFSFAAVSVLGTTPLVPGFTVPRGEEWALLLAVGLATFAGQVLLTMGLQRERAARATAVGYLQIVFATVWGAVLFEQFPGPWSLAGAALIVGSTLAVAVLREHRP